MSKKKGRSLTKRRGGGHPAPPRETTTTVSVSESRFFSGPVPSPEVMSAYKKISQDVLDTVLEMARNNAKHNHEMECRVADLEQSNVNHAAKNERLGMYLAAFVSVSIFAGATVVAVYGKNVLSTVPLLMASGLLVVGVGYPFIARFLKGRRALPEQVSLQKPVGEQDSKS